MKNILSCLILGTLISNNAYALTEKNAVKISFSAFRPEVSVGEYTAISGFSSASEGNLDVTYNDKAELNGSSHNTSNNNDFIPKGIVTKAPQIRDASIEEPLVINDWAISVGSDIKTYLPKQDNNIASSDILSEKNHEEYTNNEKEKTLFSEEFFDENEILEKESFQLNDIKQTFAESKIIDEEGIGVMAVSSSVVTNENKIEEDLHLSEKSDLKTNEADNIPLKIKEEVSTSQKEYKKTSPWAIATVRGQASNRFATIGNDKDIDKYNHSKGIPSENTNSKSLTNSSSANPWALSAKPADKEEKLSHNISDYKHTSKYDYQPDAKINQWAMREMINENPVFAISEFDVVNDSSITNNSFDDRWINEQKAVLINSISSKPLVTKKEQENTNLKVDEQKASYPQKKHLLTKIEETPVAQENYKKYNNSNSTYSYDEVKNDNDADSLHSSKISLNEVRLNFKPGAADLTIPNIRLVSSFASRVANDKKSTIEIRLSDRMMYLQSKRVTIVSRILQSNGIDKKRITTTTTDRGADTMVIRYIPSSDSKQINEKQTQIKNKIKKW